MDDRHAWELPGTHEAAPGVYRIPLPLPGDALKAVNVYAIVDGDELVLIDGGWAMAESTELLTRGLEQIGFRLDQVREFLVTHMHRDHYTHAIAVRRLVGSKVSLGEGERACLDLVRTIESHPDVPRLRTAGADELADQLEAWTAERDLSDFEYPDRWLPNGIDLELNTRTLRVISTPGHTRGHVVFHDVAAKALFAGDHVLPHITPSIGVEINRPLSPLRDFLDSLRLMRELPDSALLPAHGPPTDSTHARVDQLLDHHEKRLTDTADAVAAGNSTCFEVAGHLGWTRHQRKLKDLDMFNQILAVNETLAHLEVLRERGWLTSSVDDGVEHFTRA